MSKEETVKIMAMLGAFYGGGKTNPRMQAEAWYLILYKYDYEATKHAVLQFVENDKRDYAQFPGVGKIVDEIKKEQIRTEKPINEVVKAISYGKDYYMLSDDAKKLLSEDAYCERLNMNAEMFANHIPSFKSWLRYNQKNLLTDGRPL